MVYKRNQKEDEETQAKTKLIARRHVLFQPGLTCTCVSTNTNMDWGTLLELAPKGFAVVRAALPEILDYEIKSQS
jgi:hypothetical protein